MRIYRRGRIEVTLAVGCHLSSSKGYLSMGKEAVKINANTFQFFTRNPRGGKAKDLNMQDVESYLEFARKHGIERILAHASYTLNACSADEGLREFARNTMRDDLCRLEYTPRNCYNFHPGSHVKQGMEVGITYIAQMLNEILKPEQATTVLLEAMSGEDSEVERNFEELQEILGRVGLNNHMGVYLGTCHVRDGGYNIVNHLDEVITEFDGIIGLDRLKAIHLNGSMNPLGAHKGHHVVVGGGHIGEKALVWVINRPALKHLPSYLEMPNDLDGYAREIAFLRKL